MLLHLFTLRTIVFFGSRCFGCRALFSGALLGSALLGGTLLRTAFAGRGCRGSFLR